MDLLLFLILVACIALFFYTRKREFIVSALVVMALVNLSTMAMLFHLPAAGLILKLFAIAVFAAALRVLLYLFYLFESWTAKRGAKRQKQQEKEYRRDREAWADDYAVLGVAPGANLAEVKAAYRRLAKVYHPDAGGDPEVFVKIHAAYQKLVGR